MKLSRNFFKRAADAGITPKQLMAKLGLNKEQQLYALIRKTYETVAPAEKLIEQLKANARDAKAKERAEEAAARAAERAAARAAAKEVEMKAKGWALTRDYLNEAIRVGKTLEQVLRETKIASPEELEKQILGLYNRKSTAKKNFALLKLEQFKLHGRVYLSESVDAGLAEAVGAITVVPADRITEEETEVAQLSMKRLHVLKNTITFIGHMYEEGVVTESVALLAQRIGKQAKVVDKTPCFPGLKERKKKSANVFLARLVLDLERAPGDSPILVFARGREVRQILQDYYSSKKA